MRVAPLLKVGSIQSAAARNRMDCGRTFSPRLNGLSTFLGFGMLEDQTSAIWREREAANETWREAVSRKILSVSTEFSSEKPFRANIVGRSYDSIRVALFNSNRHRVLRTSKHIRNEASHSFLVSFQLSGQSDIVQGGSRFALAAGEIALMDGQVPFEITFTEGVERIVAVLPRQLLHSKIPFLNRMNSSIMISAGSPYAALLKQHLLLFTDKASVGNAQASFLTDNICNLLAMATQNDAQDTSARQTQAMFAYCSANLASQNLTPASVATHFRVSLRTVHFRFAGAGVTFGNWILERRLERCGEVLRNRSSSDRTIAELAYTCGFSDLSHFCKMFKRRFGVTAREWRNHRSS